MRNSAIVHLYNSTSVLQRRVVFGLDKDGIVKIATDGAALQTARGDAAETDRHQICFEYSPESFTGTELALRRTGVQRGRRAICEPTPRTPR